MRPAILLVLLVGCELVFDLPEPAPFLDGYDRRRAIDFTIALDDSLSDFPVAVRIPDLADVTPETIAFTDDNGVEELDFEVEGLENGELLAWVQVPDFEGQRIYLYSGGPTAIGRDPTRTWSDAFAGVWHLADEQSGFGGTGDSTSNNNHLEARNMAPEDAAGIFGHGRRFDITKQLAAGPLGDERGLDFGMDSFSFSVWVNTVDTSTDTGTPLAFGSGAMGGYGMFLGSDAWEASVASPQDERRTNFSATPILDRWVHLVAVVDRDQAELRTFVDGLPGDSRDLVTLLSTTTTMDAFLEIGRLSPPSDGFVGTLDEIRIYTRAVSATQISVEHKNLTLPEFLVIGEEELR